MKCLGLEVNDSEFLGRADLHRVNYPVVMACDEAYAMPLATALRSIVESNRSWWPLEFHLLSDGFSEETRRRVFDSLPKESASVRWVPVDLTHFKKFETLSYISKVTYARLLIPYVFPNVVSKLLYLDADILVLDDLRKLWETNLDGAILAAVIDDIDQQVKSGDPRIEEGVPRVRDYFNAGVLLIDLKRWRNERVSEKALEYLTRCPHTPYSDQDALNVVCDGQWKKLDPRWNFQPYYEKKKISDICQGQRPGIVHFVTREKPWDSSIRCLNAEFYDSFRSRTCFARNSIDKALDTLKGVWSHLKGNLMCYALHNSIWRWVRALIKSSFMRNSGESSR